ncbi:MAG TPA: SRPBCC family protein [Woeseiaceae bacterium]|nr:SRPBCC family protein [Woeseiaceae bacterium]
MRKGTVVLFSTGLGAAAMYYFDPARGRYRRALVRDQLVHAGHTASHGTNVIGRDTRNRAIGLGARLRSLLTAGQPDDAVLVERVRACLGRLVTHPHAVEVQASDGVVTLSGPILADEAPLLIDSILGVAGVRDLRNELDVHADAGSLPALQGNPPQRTGNRATFMQENWSPTARAAGGLGGVLAAFYGFGSRSFIGTLFGTAGLLLLTRALTNLQLRRLLGAGVPRHAVDVQKSLRINAPVDKVFELWDDFENFPRFMRHVRHVRRIETAEGKERWRWTIKGPTGTEFEFDSVVSAREENRLLGWRTEGGSLVQNAGRVRFQDNGDGTTTVDVKMLYNPVIGAVGHAIAWLLGADPKRRMDDDLLRMKSYLETGKVPRDAAEHGRIMPRGTREPLPEQRISGNGNGRGRQATEGEQPLPG